MRTTVQVTGWRRTAAIVLVLVAVPVTAASFFDPLEGGMALIAAFALNRLVRWLSDMPTNKLYMRSALAAALVGATALGLAIAQGDKGDWPIVMPLAWTYAGITLLVTLGSIQYAWDVVHGLGGHRGAPVAAGR